VCVPYTLCVRVCVCVGSISSSYEHSAAM